MSFHRKRTGIQLAYPFEEARLVGPGRKHWNQWPVLTQPKLNGERAVQMSIDSSTLLSSTENPIWSVPHINEFLAQESLGVQLDGELYAHGLSFEQISSRVSREINMHEDYRSIKLHVFDIVDETLSNAERTLRLGELFSRYDYPSCPLHPVPTRIAENYDEVLAHYNDYLASGYEGIIVRHPLSLYTKRRTTNMLKFKPRERDHYKIIGTREEQDKNGRLKNSLGSLVCSDGVNTFRVGSGYTQEQRQTLWAQRDLLVGKTICVEYQHRSDKGVPMFSTIVSIED